MLNSMSSQSIESEFDGFSMITETDINKETLIDFFFVVSRWIREKMKPSGFELELMETRANSLNCNPIFLFAFYKRLKRQKKLRSFVW